MITDTFLINFAKNINGESSTRPGYITFSSDVVTPSATDTTIPNELGTRSSVTGSRVSNQVTFNGIRTGAVASSGGDYINVMGLFSSATSGELLTEATVPNVLHTDNFDLEVDWTITFERK